MQESNDRREIGDAVSFIRDEPAEDDFFQTHGRLAAAIAAAVRADPGLRVVGLLGRWGSGKSTVIRLLKKELEVGGATAGGNTVHVFTYDAWLHQSDPVRRSFLESLLTYLIDNGFTPSNKWTETLLDLTGHVERTEVSQTPVLTTDAKWIFVSLIPVPLAVGLLDLSTIKEAWGDQWTTAGFLTFWLAMIAFAAPFFTTAARYLINKRRNPESTRTPLFPILMNRSVERIKSVTHRSPEPTSIEFGSTFRQIMEDAVVGDRRFVFVIDNLDRLAEEEALKIWATVRSFFLKDSENDTAPVGRIQPVVILPVDTHAIERMFALSEDEAIASERARSFINKTFDITFEVSEPVMSDWRAYLQKQMEVVFGERLQPTWVFWTRYFFEQSLTASTIRVTPREVNKLINRLAALFMQWDGEGIDFETLAYFAVRGPEAQNSVLDFISDQRNDIERVSADWKRQFAALHYGVAIDKAAQVLVEEPLRAAIAELDFKSFAQLANIPGFGDSFESLTTSSALNNSDNVPSFKLVTNAALLLATITSGDGYWIPQSWRNLVSRYHENAGLSPVEPDLSQRISVFYPHLSELRERQAFAHNAAVDISRALSNDAENARISVLGEAAKSLVEFILAQGLEQPTFELECEAEYAVSILAELSSDPSVWRRIRTGQEADSLVQVLAVDLATAPNFVRVPAVVRTMTEAGGVELFEPAEKPTWAPLINTAAQYVRQNSVPVATPAAIYCLGLLLEEDTAAGTAVDSLVNGGQLQTHWSGAAKNQDLQYSIAALLLRAGRDFGPPSGTNWSAILTQPNFLGSLYRRLREFVGMQTMGLIWHAHAVCPSARPLLDALIRHIIDSQDLGSIPLEDIVSNPDKYLEPIPWRLQTRFFWLLETYDTFWLRLEQAPLNDGLAEAAKLMSQKGEEQANRVHLLLKKRVEQVPATEWSNAVQTGSQPLNLTKELFGGTDLNFGVRSHLFLALSELTGQVALSPDRAFRARWFDASSLLTQRAEKELHERLGRTLLSEGNIPKLEVLFQLGGEKLIKNKAFVDDPESTTTKVLQNLMRTRRGRSFLRAKSDDARPLIRRSKPATRQHIAQSLRRIAAGTAEEKKYWAEVMLKDWRL